MRHSDLLQIEALDHLASLVAAVALAESADIPYQLHAHIHFLRNFTIEPLEPYLKFHLLRDGIRPTITYGNYGTMAQEILDPDSVINSSHPDIVVLSLLTDGFEGYNESGEWDAQHALSRMQTLLCKLMEKSDAVIVANIVISPVTSLLRNEPDDWCTKLEPLNRWLTEIAAERPDRIKLSRWNDHLSAVPLSNSIDARFWQLSQAPFKRDFLKLYALEIAKSQTKVKSAPKKCLILDCDNTLWGGVVGEDGIDHIRLHSDGLPGKEFYTFQQSVLQLNQRGIMLALCSKNNEQDVLEVLDSHPHCPLAKDHLVAWRINWQNKAENILSIAKELNIGIDSIVFVDDSPHECALVRELLPEVTTIQRPEDLLANNDFLLRYGLFDSVARTDEDQMRTQMYQQEALRKQERTNSDDLTSYLKSLVTEVRIGRAEQADLARISQLTKKTNQFNLTTRRYSEEDIQNWQTRDEAAVYSMKVKDRYGDMGLTGVFIASHKGTVGIVDTVLLSCRVLGRQLEFALVDQCMRQLEEEWSLESWQAEYLPTRKNSQVSDFWDRVGFDLAQEKSGSKTYIENIFTRSDEYKKIMTIHLE